MINQSVYLVHHFRSLGFMFELLFRPLPKLFLYSIQSVLINAVIKGNL